MKLLAAITGGFAGACALTLLHQAIKKADADAPHVDELGMEALSNGLEDLDIDAPKGSALYKWTLTGDIIANTMYYSLGAVGNTKGAPTRTAVLGLLGGLGAVYLPEPMHLTKEFTNRTPRTKFLTVGLYTIGGIVAGSVMRLLSFNTDKAKKDLKKAAKNAKEGILEATEYTKDNVKSLAKDAKKKAKELRKKVA